MIKRKNIVWLASYPKSGNTWYRVFLTNLLTACSSTADINQLKSTPIASSRQLFDDLSGIPSSELTADEIDHLRPKVYEELARMSPDLQYLKIHDAFTFSKSGDPLIPLNVTRAVIYIIRNPLDIAVSFAYHSACSIDKMIQLMNNANHMFCHTPDKLHHQLRQQLLTWSDHVCSWVDRPALPLLIIRYEDMHLNALDTFKKSIRFIGLNYTDEQIMRAIELSAFEHLREQEEKNGFIEKTSKAERFFRKGKHGSWKDELTGAQVQTIIRNHHSIMRRFGYLDKNDQPVF